MGVELRRDVNVLAKGLCDLGGGVIFAEDHHHWRKRGVPLFKFYPDICCITEEKQGKTRTGHGRTRSGIRTHFIHPSVLPGLTHVDALSV